MSRRASGRLAAVLFLIAALVLVPASVADARKGKPDAATASYAVAATFADGAATVTVTIDRYGWLHEQTPCLEGWMSVGPGTSSLSVSAQCAGTYDYTITDSAGAPLAGPFEFTAP